MPLVTPTLNFGGNCNEAINLYQKAFQAEVLCLLRYGDHNNEDYHWNLTKEQVESAYDLMKENSTTIYPIASTSYSSCRVVFIDKFGFRWGLMTEQTEH